MYVITSIGDSRGCYTENNGADYRGHKDTTWDRKSCKKWSTLSLEERISADNFPNKGLETHNNCRNPDGDSTTWCYTSYWEWGERRDCNIGQPKPSCIGMCIFWNKL